MHTELSLRSQCILNGWPRARNLRPKSRIPSELIFFTYRDDNPEARTPDSLSGPSGWRFFLRGGLCNWLFLAGQLGGQTLGPWSDQNRQAATISFSSTNLRASTTILAARSREMLVCLSPASAVSIWRLTSQSHRSHRRFPWPYSHRKSSRFFACRYCNLGLRRLCRWRRPSGCRFCILKGLVRDSNRCHNEQEQNFFSSHGQPSGNRPDLEKKPYRVLIKSRSASHGTAFFSQANAALPRP